MVYIKIMEFKGDMSIIGVRDIIGPTKRSPEFSKASAAGVESCFKGVRYAVTGIEKLLMAS